MDGGVQPGAGTQRARRIAVVSAALAVVAVAGLGISASAWGAQLDADGRLLPGATIAGAPVGGLTPDEVRIEVDAVVAPRLDREVVVTHAGRTWPVTPRDLGATTDVEEVVGAAGAATSAAGVLDLVRLRWLGADADVSLDVGLEIDRSAVATFVAGIAAGVDRDPIDATLTWTDATIEIAGDLTGERVDIDGAIDLLLAELAPDTASGTSTGTVALPVDELVAEITTDVAAAARPTVQSTIDAALDRRVSLVDGSSSWTVTPRDLGAVPDAGPVIRAGLYGATVPTVTTRGDDPTGLDVEVPLQLSDDAVDAVVAEVAGSVDVAARDAQLSWSATGISIAPGQAGLAVDRASVADQLRQALEGGADRVEVATVAVQPNRTTASYSHVLVVRQSQREVELYRDGVRTRSWPVAVGTGGSPTPTGTFTVGAKRFEPTWVNPAPDRWGKDLPARIGPGPNSPLGLRALNWNRPGGGDTLIRFHGTPNEDSIGEAASNGCVRMFNTDVVQLYDLVPTGTTIVSIG